MQLIKFLLTNMAKFSTALILLVFASNSVVASETNYYWRDYTGKIPNDAVAGGMDISGSYVYIGQAYVKDKGLIVAQINPSEKHVYAEMGGANRIEKYIKILCGSCENFAWLRSNATKLHLDLLNKQAVLGGHDDAYGIIIIGRIFYEGATQIGKVNAHSIGNANFYYVDKDKKTSWINSYEVLVYVGTDPL